MYSVWDAPALRKEALDSSWSLQQLLLWILVVAGFECDEGAEDQAASQSLQGCMYQSVKGAFSSPFPPLSVPSAPGAGVEPGGWHCPVTAPAPRPHHDCLQPARERASAGSHRLRCDGPCLRTV